MDLTNRAIALLFALVLLTAAGSKKIGNALGLDLSSTTNDIITSDSGGKLRLGGSVGQAEYLDFDFDDGANLVTVTSASGADLNLVGVNIFSDGYVAAGARVVTLAGTGPTLGFAYTTRGPETAMT